MNFYYCPFSGERLPGSIVERLFNTLARQFGQQGATDRFWGKIRLPPGFRTEQWWIDRRIGPTLEEGLDKDAEPYDLAAHPDWLKYLEQGYPKGVPNRHPPPHLCDWMGSILDRTEIQFRYHAPSRTYGIRLVDPRRPVGQQPVKLLPVTHCPGCGASLPPSLEAEWLGRLRKLGLRRNAINKPRSLATDEWWRRAKL